MRKIGLNVTEYAERKRLMLRLDLNLVWTIINVLIIFFIVKRFLIKPVNKILAARQAELDKQFADAESAQNEALELKKQAQDAQNEMEEGREAAVREAREQAQKEYDRIVADARNQADHIVAEAQALADKESRERKQQTEEEIAGLVVAAAAKLAASQNSEEENRRLYDQFLARTGGLERQA